jgi:hypothetical protein
MMLNLNAASMNRFKDDPMRSLDRCERCSVGRMKCYSVRTVGSSRLRYLRCDSCQETGRETVLVDSLGRQVFTVMLATPSTSDNSNASRANVG